MVEAVGHADGGLDPVVGRLEPGVGVSQLDRAQDVGPAPPDLFGEFDDLGYARVGRVCVQLVVAGLVTMIFRV